jgi:hypothetical protein
MGWKAGNYYQGLNAIAIGEDAGRDNQGAYSIAIGYYAGFNSQADNTVVLNATGSYLTAQTANTFVVKPIRSASTGNVLYYDDASGEITFDVGGSGGLPVANGTSNFDIATANGNVTITANSAYTWTFGTDGNLTTPGHLSVNGNITANEGGYFAGNAASGNQALYAGIPGYDPVGPGTVAQFIGDTHPSDPRYSQINFQNVRGNASTDWVATASNGNDDTYYIDMGINGNTYSQTSFFGDTSSANDGYLYIVGNDSTGPSNNIGNLILGSTNGNIKMFVGNTAQANVIQIISSSGVEVVGNIIATGNVTGGNIVTSGSGGNITLTGGNITGAGNISATGNVTAANFFGNGATLSNVATTFESTWTVPTGNSTQSFTVTPNNTYYMWVDCNIPNGILTWNATATVTNTNVPVVGAQYAWVYTGGGTPIDFTSIPNQFVGTSNTIVRSSTAPSATTNRFDFDINNASGNSQTVRYGWAQIS